VIFLPIAFWRRTVGRFLPVGIVCAVAILVSLLVADTDADDVVAPVAHGTGPRKGAGARGGRLSCGVRAAVPAALRWSLRHRWAIVLATASRACCRSRRSATAACGTMVGSTSCEGRPEESRSDPRAGGWTLRAPANVRGDRTQLSRRCRHYTCSQIGDTSGRRARRGPAPKARSCGSPDRRRRRGSRSGR
jgi:hypothetical protein